MSDLHLNLPQERTEEELETLLPRIRAVVGSFVSGPDADDIVQQTVLLYLQKRSTVRNAQAWTECVARRQALRHVRRERRYLEDSVEMALEELRLEPRQERQHLGRQVFEAIGKAPERCRALLSLRYSDGFGPTEIAKRLGYQVESVRKVASRCVASLTKQVLGE